MDIKEKRIIENTAQNKTEDKIKNIPDITADDKNSAAYKIWLNSIEELPVIKKAGLKEKFGNEEQIYKSSTKMLVLSGILSEEEISLIENSKKKYDIEREMEYLERKNISYVFYGDSEYPEKLRNIKNPPQCLFVRGKLPRVRKQAAVIGARACSNYGRELAKKIGREMADAGVSIIGGMARGIDTYGHRGALDNGGESYAVMGCGVDICYPSENIEIYEQMIERGGIISEFPIGSRPLNWHFPVRNRIISGLADLVIVVEAKKKSGSLITAEYALSQGVDVMAVPGRVGDDLSEGCNSLIQDGAYVYTGADDILELLNIKKMKKTENLNKVLEKDFEVVYSKTDLIPASLQELAEKTGFDTAKTLEILVKLQLEGIICEPVKNYYTRKA